MSGRHRGARGVRPRWWCAILLASGLMVWTTLLLAIGNGPAAPTGMAAPAIHPAAETTPNSLPRSAVTMVAGDQDDDCHTADTPDDDNTSDDSTHDDAVLAGVTNSVADRAASYVRPVAAARPGDWRPALVAGSRGPPEATASTR